MPPMDRFRSNSYYSNPIWQSDAFEKRLSPFLEPKPRMAILNTSISRLNYLSNPNPTRYESIERCRPRQHKIQVDRTSWVRCENCGLKYDSQKSKKIHQRYYCVGKDMPRVKFQSDPVQHQHQHQHHHPQHQQQQQSQRNTSAQKSKQQQLPHVNSNAKANGYNNYFSSSRVSNQPSDDYYYSTTTLNYNNNNKNRKTNRSDDNASLLSLPKYEEDNQVRNDVYF